MKIEQSSHSKLPKRQVNLETKVESKILKIDLAFAKLPLFHAF